jgi:hypothetical protein
MVHVKEDSFFKHQALCSVLKDRTDRLFRNVDEELPIHPMQYPKTAKILHVNISHFRIIREHRVQKGAKFTQLFYVF